MRALVQRVSKASVSVDNEVLGQIGPGLLVFVGLSVDDSERDVRHIVNKTLNLRIFADETGRFNHSVLDIGAELLIISQFTLYGDTRRGRRPSFVHAARPEQAGPLFDTTIKLFMDSGLKVETGRFQAYMDVAIHNDGPVTIMLDSADRTRPRRES